jgi:hypothetical protein
MDLPVRTTMTKKERMKMFVRASSPRWMEAHKSGDVMLAADAIAESMAFLQALLEEPEAKSDETI